MTLQDEYTPTIIARRTEEAWTNAAEVWSKNISKVTDQVRVPFGPEFPVNPTAFLEPWFDFAERVTKANREYADNLSGVLNSFGDAVRQRIEALTEAVRDQAQATSATAKTQVDQVAEAERERVKQAEREQARAAREAERQRVRQAREAAHERYEGQTKAELSEELGRRELPKTGNVDELIERLVDADTQ